MAFKLPIVVLSLLAASAPGTLLAQGHVAARLPNAPRVNRVLIAPARVGPQGIDIRQAQGRLSSSNSAAPILLTRQQAEKIALANNPRIRVSQLLAKVQHQVTRETRADELPDLSGNLTAVEAEEGSRISAGTLSASRLVEHAGLGIQLRQLITDFGHTR